VNLWLKNLHKYVGRAGFTAHATAEPRRLLTLL
jgi:hypothetical protein